MLTIYTNETCPYCKAIKEELTKENIKFKEKLTVNYKHEWQDIVSLINMSTVPTILEKIKTLNYSIHMAFGRTDQLLRQIENKLNIKENEYKSTD